MEPSKNASDVGKIIIPVGNKVMVKTNQGIRIRGIQGNVYIKIRMSAIGRTWSFRETDSQFVKSTKFLKK